MTPYRCRARTPVFVLGLLVLSAAPARALQDPLAGLDAYIEAGMRAWNVPGLAIAVVKDDSVIFARGYGVREVGKPDKVDPHTIFAIGSSTKPITAAAVAMLVDAGSIAWDDPATRYLPRLQLSDPYVTRELTVLDLLTHRSGLPRGDLMWIAGEFDREELLHRVRFLEPAWSFRSRFGYQNLMYLAAGEVIPAVTGLSWDEFVRARIFAPLGMSRSSTTIRALEGQTNVAVPHAEIEGTVRPVRWRDAGNVGPAGSVNSSVLDMAQWIRMNLNEGSHRGRALLEPGTVQAMFSPQTVVRREGGWATMAPESRFMAYGIGWFLNDHRGRKVVQHGGNLDGMHALVGMIPDERLGVVILTNLNPHNLTYALMYRIFDAYLGAEPVDWSARMLAARDSLRARQRARAAEAARARAAGTRPSLPLDAYVGRYADRVNGDIVVIREGDSLVLRWGPRQDADLNHWHHDTFEAVWRDPGFLSIFGRSQVTFTLDVRGRVDRVAIPAVGDFERVDDPAT